MMPSPSPAKAVRCSLRAMLVSLGALFVSVAIVGCASGGGDTVKAAGAESDDGAPVAAADGTDEEATDGTAVDGTAVDGTAVDGTVDGTAVDGTEDDLPPFPPLGDQTAPVLVVGEPLDLMPSQIPVTEPDNDPAIGQIAPEITGSDFSGAPVEILADGTPRVIMFVAHWCPHCQREVPAVLELIEAGALPDGLELVIVSTAVREDDSTYPPQDWLQQEGWRRPIVRDSEDFEALIAFGAGGFPFSVYLDADHRVVTRSAGELPSDILQQLWLATAQG